MYPNSLKARLKSGEIILGSGGVVGPSLHLVGAIATTQPDFIWIDTEHQPFGSEALPGACVIMRLRGVAPMVRVPWNDPALIKKAYDAGAVAVMVPQVDDAAAAARAVDYARYPPLGNRGISPNWQIIAGESFEHVIDTANEETVLMVQMESKTAYENLDEIIKVPGIDVIMVGPLDLSASLGKTGDTSCKEVQEIMQDVPRRLEGTGLFAATTLGDVAEVQEKIRWGYQMINVGSVLNYGAAVLKNNLEALRENPRG
jgi:4-hydroxy-2-oxoheptanedioate aldolase